MDHQVGFNIGGGVGEKEDPGSAECRKSIEAKLSKLSLDTLNNYGNVCIYKVPEKHRNKNQEAYTPRLISIGLVHFGESHLQAMEEYKLKYLNNFLRTFRVSLKELVEYVHGHEEKLVCGFYEDIYVRNDSAESKAKPSEVILLDGIFVLVLFLKNHFLRMREEGDIIFDNPSVSNDISHDLMLFENQLPLRFLSKLYESFVCKRVGKWLDDDTLHAPSFNELAHKYFKGVGSTGKVLLKNYINHLDSAKHFVAFLSILHMPSSPAETNSEEEAENKLDYTKCPTTSELRAAGVDFQQGKGKCLLDVDFDSGEGVLRIPPLTVSDSTETLFHNLIAFEQSGHHVRHITSYVVLWGNLIKTHKDVDLLVESKIIKNEFGSSEKVAELFSNLYKDLVVDPEEFHFVQTCRLLHGYRRSCWHSGKVFIARRLTASISVIAILVFVLSLVQAVCSVLQVVLKK